MGKKSFFISIIIIVLLATSKYNNTSAFEGNNESNLLEPNNMVSTVSKHIYIQDNVYFSARGVSNYFFSRNKAFTIHDYSDITNPEEIYCYYLESNCETFHSFYLNESLLYLFLDTGVPQSLAGFEIVDIYNISSPEFKGNFTVIDSSIWWEDPRCCGVEILQFKDEYVFLQNGPSNHTMKWIRIIDCSNLTSPKEINKYESINGSIRSFVISEEVMYVLTTNGFFDIVNITDASNPNLISSLEVGNYNVIKHHNNYLFLYGSSENREKIYNVANRTNPQYVSDFFDDTQLWIYDLVFSENQIFVVSRNHISLYDYTNIYDITLINSHNFTEFLLEANEIIGNFFWGIIDNNRLYLSRLSDNVDLTVFIVDFSDRYNFDIYTPYFDPNAQAYPFTVYLIVGTLIITSCVVISLLVIKLTTKKRYQNKLEEK